MFNRRDPRHSDPSPTSGLGSLLNAIMESTGEGILVLDRDRRIVLYNRRAAEMWDLPGELERSGSHRSLLRYGIEQLTDPAAFLDRARQFDWSSPDETRDVLELKGGRIFERYSIPHTEKGEIVGRVWSFRDVTEQHVAARAIERAEQRYRMLFDRNLAGVYISRLDGTIVDCNPSFARLLGFSSSSELVGHRIDEFQRSPVERQEIRQMLNDVPALAGVEVSFLTRSGGTVHALENITRIEVDGTAFNQGTVVDIDDLKRAEEQVRFHAYHDILTCLPNRQLFRDRLRLALAHARRTNQHAAVMFIDIDDFKKVNDTLGHTAGDELLILLAERLGSILRGTDTVSRPGGDEFHFIVGDAQTAADAEGVAQKILQTITKPLSIGDRDVVLTASIGIAMYPADGVDEESLMKSADNALFAAKQAGRNTHRLATPELNRRVTERFTLEGDLRQAMERQELLLHYQPIVHAVRGHIVALEALVRWIHPERGLLQSEEFISVAEETGLIIPLGEWVLRRACADAVAWQADGLPGVRVAVNVSPKQFQRPQLGGMVQRALAAAGLRPEMLEIEVTEGVAARDPEQSTRILSELREQGVRIALDDIGTGYSSLAYLKQFPVSTVKIDKSFVQTVLTERSDAAIVAAVITVAHSLDMTVVAEGVERAEQATFLRQSRCDLLQGYHFGLPMAIEDWRGRRVTPGR